MNAKIIDEVGNRYGELVVLKFSHINDNRNACWKCLCDCGNTCIAVGTRLRTGLKTRCRKCGYTASHKTRRGKGYKKTRRESSTDVKWRVLPNRYINGFWPEHPLAIKSNGNVYQHWVVWAEYNGIEKAKHFLKYLHCTIHHRNGNRGDNQIENLQLRFPGKHPKGWTEEVMIEELKNLGYIIMRGNNVR